MTISEHHEPSTADTSVASTRASAAPVATVVNLPPAPASSSETSRYAAATAAGSTQRYQQIPPPGTSTSPPLSSLKTYRGGFHTSICDIFRNPQRRTDCCAVACCGVLSSDRSRYLILGERPPPLWRRVLIYLIIPALFVAAMNYFAVEVTYSANDPNGTNPYSSGGNSNYNPNYSPSKNDAGEGAEDDGTTVKEYPFPLRLAFLAYIIAILVNGRLKKQAVREEIMKKLYQERLEGEEVDEQQMRLFIRRHNLDTIRAHRTCSCCYAQDDEFYADGTMMGNVVGVRAGRSENGGTEDYIEGIDVDFCTRVWDCLSKTFWESCCGCYCQCCSLCALAQEEWEVNRLTGNTEHKMDYITFQPYSEYFPSIQNLRENQISSPFQHIKALSDLSKKLLKNVFAVLVVLILFALTNIDSNFNFENMIVLLMTLGQAFFIEYLVHWRWNRFDLSLDSVVKYFACGFFLTTPMAIVFEAIISTIASFALVLIVVIVVASDDSIANELETDPKKGMKDFATEYQAVFILYIFVNAFVVAALVEEMVKYFGYWMVVVPDLLPQQRSNRVQNDVDESETDGSRIGLSSTLGSKTVKSTGTGITVAMVSVALGFACCENLMYVFVYSPPSLGVEISTLLARSLFPVHPLCAAIQSIGVCKRDLEGDRRFGIGRVIAPSVLLHGSFDFVLMLAAYLQQLKNIEEGNDDDGNTQSGAEEEETEDLASQLPAMIAGFVMVLVGFVFFVVQSRAQTVRLQTMDNAARDQSSLLV